MTPEAASARTLTGHVVSVNVGLPRPVIHDGRMVLTAIFKEPVEGRRAVSLLNIEGDRQADLSVHGGADKAVYVYSAADASWWGNVLGRPLGPAAFGENLTVTTSWPLGETLIGDRWRIGTAAFEVAQPRLPCYKLGIRMGDAAFVNRFADAARFGLYLRVVEPGEVGAGDALEVVERPSHGVTVEMVGRARLGEHSLAPMLVDAEALPAAIREWAARHRG